MKPKFFRTAAAFRAWLTKNHATQPPSYRKTIVWWVVSAKQEATQLKRLGRLIEESVLERRL